MCTALKARIDINIISLEVMSSIFQMVKVYTVTLDFGTALRENAKDKVIGVVV